jgi:hypothetical protein
MVFLLFVCHSGDDTDFPVHSILEKKETTRIWRFGFDKKIKLEQESCESNILSFNLNDYKDSSAYVQKLLNFFSLKKRYDSIMSSIFDDISDFTISNEMSNFKILSAKNEIDDLQKQCSDAILRINELNAIIEEQRMLSSIELENIQKSIIANNNFPEADFNNLKEINSRFWDEFQNGSYDKIY